jgi:streptomycin 6-kinase
LAWLRGSPSGADWLAALPGTLDAVVAQWSLRIGRPYQGSRVSLVLPATLPDGTRTVLKLQFPDGESDREAEALRCWDGNGAVRLLAHDPVRRALLTERCSPGDHLAGAGADTALTVFAALLRLLCRPADEAFTTLSEAASGWADGLATMWAETGRPCERRLVEAAAATLRDLCGEPPARPVLLHQDLHAYNVLRAQRLPWLAIDPKPLVGDPAFAIAPIVRDHELGHSRRQVQRRLHRLSAELGLDRERAGAWAFGQTMAWALRDGARQPRHLDTVRWLAPL